MHGKHPRTDTVTPDVRTLQAMAQRASIRRKRSPGLSRAARLNLIDALSRQASLGLAVIAGVSIFAAVSTGRMAPLRAAVWAGMVLAALFVCRRLARFYRLGALHGARPFHWRADYTAALCVLGAAYAAGFILLTPGHVESSLSLQTAAALSIGGILAGLAHAPHGAAAAALWAPCAAAGVIGASRADAGSALLFAVLAAVGAALIAAVHAILRARAAKRFPRTASLRRDFHDEYGAEEPVDSAAPAALGA